MPGSTTNGFPYPLATDLMSAGPATLQALAQKSDDMTLALGKVLTPVDLTYNTANFSGPGLMYARFGPLVFLMCNLSVIASGYIATGTPRSITMGTFPTAARPLGFGVNLRLPIPSTGVLTQDGYNVSISTTGVSVWGFGPGSQAANQPLVFSTIYPGSSMT